MMRKLNRNSIAPPACLNNYQHGRNCWSDVTPDHRAEIRESLEQMQGKRCAYCEGSLDELGRHIEHFRRKHVFPQLTFSWKNLYWSCDRSDSCGHFKDKRSTQPYNPNDLIEPCVDDPDKFFRFHSDGTIRIRDNLSTLDRNRASETLRVFNLNPKSGRLRALRKRSADTYMGIIEDLRGWSEHDKKNYVKSEIHATADEPFSTLIRHLFESIL